MDERDLVKRSQAGDEGAFEALIEINRPKIFRLCMRIVHNRESAEDLTQETFVHAFEHLKQFRGASSFYTWIYAIAHNLSVNYLKKKGQIKESEWIEGLSHAASSDEEGLDPAILETIEKLPPKLREVFKLYVLQKIPQKEIAARLGIPYGTVRSRLYKARQFMRERAPREV